MKRIILILIIASLLVGCGGESGNINFTAIVEDVKENEIIVTTDDDVGFDRASVGISKIEENLEGLKKGDVLEIEALTDIMESAPVQITAVKIDLKEHSNDRAEYIRITPEEAMEMMGEGVIILDVRTQGEFDEGHIPNAILLPNTEIASKAEDLLPNKEQTILVYCRSGNRSRGASKELLRLGYTNVYDFGGIMDWPGEIVEVEY